MELKTTVYLSSARSLYSDTSLLALLAKSRRNNVACGVTGLLLYDDGNFIQALEGPAAGVDTTYDRILRDPAHHQIIRLYEEAVSERSFAEWSMGFADVAQFRDAGVPGLSDFLDVADGRKPPSTELVRNLLDGFRRRLSSVRHESLSV